MKEFESGISDYVHCTVTADIAFPVNKKGVPVITCDFCKMFRGKRCALTEEIIYDPEHFVGYECPLRKEKEER